MGPLEALLGRLGAIHVKIVRLPSGLGRVLLLSPLGRLLEGLGGLLWASWGRLGRLLGRVKLFR
eukprot:1627883-Pyramimonas_sp.AAC.1